MFAFLSNFLQLKQIKLFSALPLEACRIQKPYLLERSGITSGSVLIFAVPYLTATSSDPHRDLSSYAVSKDYHLFFRSLFDELLTALHQAFPNARAVGFADHSPIDEVHAASLAGLGVMGENRLLITKKYSSYVFLGEVITDADLGGSAGVIKPCIGCHKCRSACPAAGATCLSATSQKKGELTSDEANLLASHATVWGCDVCQEVCPHTRMAMEAGTIFTDIPYFYESPVANLTLQALNAMDEEAFGCRAYAWRGRSVIERNLKLKEEKTGC